ncbi:MAG: DegT/DnrJ/EryC1/StrS family aminotransferase [Pseudomonadota bacterium]|nr:DegT/DnrJ/EryC1/StrS family aminotransferase [Pseudomonadota bacterium]
MAGYEAFGKEEIKEVMDVMETGILMRYGFDAERKGVFKVRQFEEEFAAACGTAHALGVTSGSAALKVALTALDVGPGDEVICPAFTFIATYEAVLEVGAIPIMADIDASLNLDPDDIINKMTPYTKAVIPVHMCGAPANIDRIVEVARKSHLLVLEDAAQAVGASFRGKKLGAFGDMGIFSFDFNKTITTGEGGMIVTDREDLYKRADWYHDHGHDHNPKIHRAQEDHPLLGFNYRMNELQGALGLAQFRKLPEIIAAQRQNKAALKDALGQVPGLTFRNIPDPDGDTATFLGFHLPDAAATERFQSLLGEEKIDAVLFKKNKWHYVPNWEHLIAWSTANSKKYPFTYPGWRGKVDYSIRIIPRAEELLGRTLFMAIPVKLPAERLERLQEGIAKAARRM